ncbi:hypothetical protein [Phenylobacterium sp.]|uniref:hypothetical protein n=1 Tax=Phenylobacterium sp. TaxID=1871053 RepID=UPI003785010A
MRQVFRLAALAFLGAGLMCGAPAAAQAPTPVERELEATFRRLEEIIESGAPADVLTREMYTTDTVVTGYGVDAPRVGIAAEERAIAGFLDSLAAPGQRRCRFAVFGPVSASEGVIAAFTNLTCRGRGATSPEPDQKYHVLYVFRKTTAGWRVSLEMFGGGLLR